MSVHRQSQGALPALPAALWLLWTEGRAFFLCIQRAWAAQVVLVVKNPPAGAGDVKRSPGGVEDPLEEGMATHSSILAWRSPWTEEPGGLQSRGSHRVGHAEAT